MWQCSYGYQFAGSPLGVSGTSSIPIARNSGHIGPATGSTMSSAPGTSSRPSGASTFVIVQWSEIVRTSNPWSAYWRGDGLGRQLAVGGERVGVELGPQPLALGAERVGRHPRSFRCSDAVRGS